MSTRLLPELLENQTAFAGLQLVERVRDVTGVLRQDVELGRERGIVGAALLGAPKRQADQYCLLPQLAQVGLVHIYFEHRSAPWLTTFTAPAARCSRVPEMVRVALYVCQAVRV